MNKQRRTEIEAVLNELADLREMLKQGKVEFIGNYPIPKH